MLPRLDKVGGNKLYPQREKEIEGVHFLVGCDSLV
jgi:hypothetical protein